MESRELAIITGGTSGIGFAVARKLASNYDLALVHGSNRDRAAAAAETLRDIFPERNVQTFCVELLDSASCKTLFEQIRTRMPDPIAILVNAAGRIRDQLFMTAPIVTQEILLAEHLLVPMAMAHLVLPEMYRRRRGYIVNIGSASGQAGRMGQTGYCAAKAGIEGFTRALALETAARGITINTVAPGLIATPMTEGLLKSKPEMKSNIPVGFVGEPEDVANLVAFLCSEQGRYITGAVLPVDGGKRKG